MVCNNPNFTQPRLIEFLRDFHPAPALRMLIHMRRNFGFTCGELHALAATVRVWRRFPWVLYNRHAPPGSSIADPYSAL
jgi:hypothetical protein